MAHQQKNKFCGSTAAVGWRREAYSESASRATMYFNEDKLDISYDYYKPIPITFAIQFQNCSQIGTIKNLKQHVRAKPARSRPNAFNRRSGKLFERACKENLTRRWPGWGVDISLNFR
jgi:hypothetical protein